MSTRCQIGVYEKKDQEVSKPDVLMYRHCDGYPEGVVPDLLPFLKSFHKVRGMSDVSYLGAWLMYHLINRARGEGEDPETYDCHGYGIDTPAIDGFHGNIEYFYFIAPGILRVYEIDGWDVVPGSKGWRIIEEHKIEGRK